MNECCYKVYGRNDLSDERREEHLFFFPHPHLSQIGAASGLHLPSLFYEARISILCNGSQVFAKVDNYCGRRVAAWLFQSIKALDLTHTEATNVKAKNTTAADTMAYT